MLKKTVILCLCVALFSVCLVSCASSSDPVAPGESTPVVTTEATTVTDITAADTTAVPTEAPTAATAPSSPVTVPIQATASATAAPTVSTTTVTTTTVATTEDWRTHYTSRQLIGDPDFQDGFYIRQQDPIVDLGPWRTTASVKKPTWMLAQWWSFYSYTDRSGYQCLWKTRHNTAANILQNDIYRVEYNDSVRSLTMAVDTVAFYGGHGHTDNSNWPHLLIEQYITDATKLRALSEEERLYYTLAADKVILTLDIRMTAFEHVFYEGINACQFSSVYYIQSISDGGFTWFVVPHFDDRGYSIGGGPTYHLDTYSGQFVYTIPQYVVNDNTLETGRYDFFNAEFTAPEANDVWMHIELDIKPWLLELAEKTMGKTTYPKTTDLSQLFISGLNLGYEIHGSYQTSFEIKNYTLTSYVKK